MPPSRGCTVLSVQEATLCKGAVKGAEKSAKIESNGVGHVASRSTEPNRVGLVLRACRRAGSFCVWFDLLANYNVRSPLHSDDTQARPSIALAADPPARPPQGAQRERRGRRQYDARVRATAAASYVDAGCLGRTKETATVRKQHVEVAVQVRRRDRTRDHAAAGQCDARREGAVARVEQHSAGTAIIPKQHVEVV